MKQFDIEAAHLDALPAIASGVWSAFAAGEIAEGEATGLQARISARQGGARAASEPRGVAHRPPAGRRVLAARERARRWAAAGRMPPGIACKFTLGEQAALAVVAWEVGKRGACTLSHKAVADLGGVGISTVKRALRQARALGLVTIEERRLTRRRNDTNVVRIVSREWAAWIERRGGGQDGTGANTEDQKAAIEERRASASHAPCPLPWARAGAGGSGGVTAREMGVPW